MAELSSCPILWRLGPDGELLEMLDLRTGLRRPVYSGLIGPDERPPACEWPPVPVEELTVPW